MNRAHRMLNSMPASLRRKTTPELIKYYHEVLNKPEVQTLLQEPKLSQAEAVKIYYTSPFADKIGLDEFYCTGMGNALLDYINARMLIINYIGMNLLPYVADLVTVFQDKEWKTLRDAYSINLKP